MKNHQKYFKLFITVFIVCYLLLVIGSPVLAAPPNTYGLEETAKAANLKGTGDIGVATMIGNIVSYILAFVGVIFFVLMVYGGFIWMLARGNEEHIKKAKEIIEAAILGLVIIFLAYTVTNFVLNRLLAGAGITTTPAGGVVAILHQ